MKIRTIVNKEQWPKFAEKLSEEHLLNWNKYTKLKNCNPFIENQYKVGILFNTKYPTSLYLSNETDVNCEDVSMDVFLEKIKKTGSGHFNENLLVDSLNFEDVSKFEIYKRIPKGIGVSTINKIYKKNKEEE